MDPLFSKFRTRITYLLGASSMLFVGLQNGDVYKISKTREFIGKFEGEIHKLVYHNKMLFVLSRKTYALINGEKQIIDKGYTNIYCKDNYVVFGNQTEIDKYKIDKQMTWEASFCIPENCIGIWMNTLYDPVSIHMNGAFSIYKNDRELEYKEFKQFEYFIPGSTYFFVLSNNTLYLIDCKKVKTIKKLFEEPIQSIHIHDSLYCFVNHFLYKFDPNLEEKILVGWGGDRNVAFFKKSMFQSVDNFLLELKIKKHEYL